MPPQRYFGRPQKAGQGKNYLWENPMKKLLFPFALLLFAGCHKDESPAPSVPVTTDSRDAYTGNYHFQVARSKHVFFPSSVTNDTTLFDGRVTTNPANDTTVLIAFGVASYDSIFVKPDNTGYFLNYTLYGTYPGTFTNSGSVSFSQYSIYNADSTCFDVVSGTKY